MSAERLDYIERVAHALPRRTGQLGRLMSRHAGAEISRGMASALVSLEDGQLRITELAEREALTQPTVTRLVQRLESRGLVQRAQDPADGRVVIVQLTRKGRGALDRRRRQVAAVLRERLAGMSDDELRQLVEAIDAIDGLVERLQPAEATAIAERSGT